MRTPAYLPDEVTESISRHIAEAVRRSIEAHSSAAENEDTLTGQLGFALQTRSLRKVRVTQGEIRGTWRWSLKYRKFRGIGPQPTEFFTGADGIFEFSLVRFGEEMRKSALFQAKTTAVDRERLLAQCIKLSTWREAAFLINYRPDHYTALTLDDATSFALRIGRVTEVPLESFLADWFIRCLVGDSELHYEPGARVLQWRDAKGERIHVPFLLGHRFAFQVHAPDPRQELRGRAISPDEIASHRMEATAEEILGVGRDITIRDLDNARKRAAKIYHPDLFEALGPAAKSISTLRSQEINDARDRVYARLKEEEEI